MIERPDIDELFAGPLGSWLAEQALVREAAREKSNSRIVKSAFIILPLGAFLFFGPSLGDFAMFLFIAAVVGAGWWCYAPRAKAVKETKTGINSALAGALGLEYRPDPEPGIGFQRARTFAMVPGFTRSSFEDEWRGVLSGQPFCLHEAHLEQKRSSGKSSHYVTVFRGPVMTIGLNRTIHGTTLVERAGKHRNFLFFGEKDTLEIDGRAMRKVDMVHPQFEDEFTVYSTDQVEARYLVHPAYVERLIALESAFSGSKIRALFQQGELTVVLESDNMFESGNMDASRDREMVATCIDQFMSMADLAGTLNEPAR